MPAIFACAIAFSIFVLFSASEINYSCAGQLLGVESILFVALYRIYVNGTFAAADNNERVLPHNNAALRIGCPATFVILAGERERLGELLGCSIMTLTGVTGFMINHQHEFVNQVYEPFDRYNFGSGEIVLNATVRQIVNRIMWFTEKRW